jgi:hypothetical protein
MDYFNSSLSYRVYSPVWSGSAIERDPVYIAYMKISNVSTTGLPWIFLFSAVIVGTVALLGAFYELKRAINSIVEK